MRCYICDWSPTCESLYLEGISVNGFVSSDYEGILGGVGRLPSTQYSNNRLIDLKDGRSICSHCNRSAQVAGFEMLSWDSDEAQPEEREEEDLPAEVEDLERAS